MGVAGGLVGRAGTKAAIAEAWTSVVDGRAQAITVTGPLGSGKTAVLGFVRELVGSEALVMTASGHPWETELPYAALHQLLRPFEDDLGPDLRRVLRRDAGEPTDRMMVASALLELFSTAGNRRPVLVLVDDLQWLDVASRQALIFVSRRLDAESLLLLAATSSEDDTLPGTQLDLPLLSDDDARRLLLARHSGLHPSALRQIVSSSGGLPLALVEIGDALDPEQRSGLVALPQVLPLGPTLNRLHRARLAQLDDQQRAALLVAALTGSALGDTRRGLAVLGLSPADLSRAEDLGLVSVDQDQIRFSHPTIRIAAREYERPGTLQRIHAALATVADDPVARGWHVHHAGPHSELDAYEALSEGAVHAAGLGALSEAARCWQAASKHARDASEVFASTASAAGAMLGAGMMVAAEPLVTKLEHDAPTLDLEAIWATQRLGLALWRSSPECLGDDSLVELGAELVQEGDVVAGHGLLTAILMAHVVWGVEPPDGLIDTVRDHSFESSGRESVACLLIDAMNGDLVALDTLADQWVASIREPRSLGEAMEFTSAAYALLWFDRVEACERLVELCDELPVRPLSELRAVARMLDGLCAIRRGDWTRADLELESAARLAEDGDLPVALLMIRRHQAIIAATRGDRDRCDALLVEASAGTSPIEQLPWVMHLAHCARGLLHHALGDLSAAADEFGRAEEIELDRALTSYLPGQEYRLAEHLRVLIRLGRTADAHATLDRVDPHAGWPSVRAATELARAQIDDSADGFAVALKCAVEGNSRLDEARIELTWGEVLRRQRQGREAIEHLQRAHDLYASMGVTAWVDHARAELRAAGVRRTSLPTTSPLSVLTPREYDVVRAVASGATNAEAANHLFISTRTVGYHLSRAYQKLGINDRHSLVDIVFRARL